MFPFQPKPKPKPLDELTVEIDPPKRTKKDDDKIQITWNPRIKGVVLQATLEDGQIDVTLSTRVVFEAFRMLIRHAPPKTPQDMAKLMETIMGVLQQEIPGLEIEGATIMDPDSGMKSMLDELKRAMKGNKN